MPYIMKNGTAYAGNAVTLTQAQYDALSNVEKHNGTVYYIYDSDEVLSAEDVKYGNTTVDAALDQNASDISSLKSGLTYSAINFTGTYAQGIAYKWGRVVTVVINNGEAGDIAAGTTLMTLPIGYRPANVAEFVNTYAKTRVRVNSDGSIVAIEAINASFVRGSVTYIAS